MTDTLRAEAEAGQVGAQLALAFAYLEGEGCEADAAKAYHWLEQAARQGHAVAQYNLGVLLASGLGIEAAAENDGNATGVAAKPEEAVYWFTLAAEQGEVDAQNNLAAAYIRGHGVAQDFEAGVSWLMKAAEQGSANAQHNLGWLFEREGKPAEARMWYRKAAEQNHPQALERLLTLV